MSIQRKWRRAWAREQKYRSQQPVQTVKTVHNETPSHYNLVRKLVPSAVAASLMLTTMSSGAAMAQQIVVDGNTQTNVGVNGNVTNITTSTVAGQNAYNSFSNFALDSGNIANFYLPGNTANLLNVVTSPVSINGMVNSIQNSNIGGNMYFITPGFVVGGSGVLNVGSLKVVTPTQDYINNFFVAPGNPSATATIQAINGQVPIDSNGCITIQGKVNAINNINLAGGTVINTGMMTTGAFFAATRPDMSNVVNLNGLENGAKIAVENGNIEIVAGNDFKNSGTITTDGASNQNAGNISITAGDNLTIDSGSKISARGYGDSSAGDITLFGKVITLNHGSQLLAYDSKAINGGKITLEAKDTATSGYAGVKSANASIRIGDASGGATLRGGDIKVHAVAIAENGVILPDPDCLDSAVAIATTTLAELPSILSDFTGSNVISSSAEAQAAITIKKGSILDAGDTVDLKAQTLAEAGSKPYDIPALDLYVKMDVPLATGILYSNLAAHSTVAVEDGAAINAKDLNIAAHNEATLDAAIAAEPPAASGTATVSLAVGLSWADVTSAVNVGGDLNVSDNVQITATNKGSYSTEVMAKSGTDGVAAGAVALSFRDSSATANLTADLADAAQLGVYAVNDITEDVIDVSTKSGTTTLADIANKLEMNITDKVQSPIYKLLGLSSLSPSTKVTDPAQQQKLRVGGAIAYADHTDNATATIGGSANIHTTGPVAVASLVNAENTSITATSAAVSNSVNDLSDGDTSKQSYSVGLAIGDYNRNSLATVGLDVTITSSALGISSKTSTPIRNFDVLTGIAFNEWSNVSDFVGATDELITSTEDIAGLTEMFNGRTSSKAVSDGAAKSINMSGSVGILTYNNTSQAIVDTGAKLNLTGAATGQWTTGPVTLTEGSAAKAITIAGTSYTYKNAAAAENIIFSFEKQAQVKAENDNTLLFLGGPVIPSSSGEVGAGASFDMVTVNSDVNAIVREGAVIQGVTENNDGAAAGSRTWTVTGTGRAPEFEVSSKNLDKVVSLVATSGYGATYGVNGTVAVTNVNQKSYAWIDDEATVKTNNLAVNATSTPLVWSIAGEASMSKGVNVGLGIAVNEITGDTRAEITDNDTVSTDGAIRTSQLDIAMYNPVMGTGALILAPVIDVVAHTGGNIGTYSITGSVVNYSDSKTPGFFSKLKNTYTGLTSKAADIVGLTQTTIAKNNQSIAEPDPPSFGISGAGSISVNTVGQQNTAKVDHVYIDQSRPAGMTAPASLTVRGTADPTIVAASGSAAITRIKSNEKIKAGISGSVAVNQIGNGNSAILSNSTVVKANDLDVQALSSGERVSVAIGAEVDSQKGSTADFSAALAGSVSLTLDEKSADGKTNNFTSALIENTSITGDSSATGRDVAVIAYNSAKVGTGGGSLELQPVKGDSAGTGVGAAVTYADVSNDVTGRISNSTITSVDTTGVHAYNASTIGAGGGTAALTNDSNTLAVGGTFVISRITANTTATVEDSTFNTKDSVTVEAKNKEIDSTLEALIEPGGESIAKNLDYTALGTVANGNGIVSVAGVVQAAKGPNAGFSVNYSNLSDNLKAEVKDSTVNATGSSGSINVKTASNANILGLAIGVGVSNNNISGAGSVAIGEVENSSKALVSESSILTANQVRVEATDDSTIQTVAGQVNVAIGKNAAVGAAVTYNEIANTVTAQVDNSTIHAPAGVTVAGYNTAEIDSIAAAGTLSAGNPAVSGSVTVNFIDNTTQGQVVNGSLVDAGTGTANNVTVSSTDSSILQSLAGSLAISGGQAGAGGAFAYNGIDNTNSALVDDSTINEAANFDLTATEDATMNTLSAAASGGQTAGLSGSVSINRIGSEISAGNLAGAADQTVAELKNSTVNGATVMNIKGSDTSEINSCAGAAAGSGGAAFGGAIANNNIYSLAGGYVSGSTLQDITELNLDGQNTATIKSAAVSGSGAASGAFAGSATANTIGNYTLAGITDSTFSGSTADVAINSRNTGTIEALSGGVGIAGTAGVGLAIAVNRIGNETDAYINGNGAGKNYNLKNLAVKGISGNTIKSAAVGVGGGGNVGVAGSTATNYISSNTKAYISGGAVVISQDNAGVIAQTDDVITNLAGSAGIGIATAGVGASVTVNVISGDTSAYIDGAGTKVSALAQDSGDTLTVSNGELNGSVDLAGGLDLAKYARTDLKGMRKTAKVTGVAVNATATHSVENIVANLAGGVYAGVAGTTNTSLVTGNTKAYIDTAAINSSGTGSAYQNLSVIAGDHAYSNGFVGALAAGAAGVGIGDDANVFTNTTQAYITNSGTINAKGGIGVNAISGQGASSLAVSGSGGVVGVAGTASVGVFGSTTEAYLKSDTINTGSLTVNTDHYSNFFTAVGGVTVAGAAQAGSFAIVSDDSANRAYIDGSTVTQGGDIKVEADNTVNISNWSVSGAGGGAVGVAGSVAVSLINNATEAYVANSLLGASGSKVGKVNVMATDTIHVNSQAGALGVGVDGWGVGAGASVVELANTTSSYINNSDIYASNAVSVGSEVERTLSNQAFTLGIGGTAGISGSAAVTLVGKELSGAVNTSELDKDDQGTLTQVNNLTNSNRLSNQNVNTGLTGVTLGITTAEMDQVNAAGKFSTDSRLNSDTLSYRTAALISGDSVITAGSVQVNAYEKDDNRIQVGGLAAGSVGIGGAVGVMDVNRNVQASVLTTADGTPQIITAGGIGVNATIANLTANPSLSVESYQGSAGIVGLGAAVSVAAVTNNVTASVDRGVTLNSNSGGITIEALDNSSVASEAYGFAAGWAAAGIVSATADKDGTVSAAIGDTDTTTGVITTVNSGSGALAVESSRSGAVSALTLAGSGGVVSGNGSEAIATEDGAVNALIGNQVKVTSGGKVQVEAVDMPQVYAEQKGYGGSLVAQVGIGFASATATPEVTAQIGSYSDIAAGSLIVDAVTRLNNENDSAYSYAEAVGVGAYLNAGVNQSKAETQATVRAKIGNNTKLNSGSTTISASNTTKEEAVVSGVSASLLAAAGSFAADANANSITNATLGDGVYGDAGDTLTVLANGVDNTFAKAKAGSGGLLAGAAAMATTHNGSATTATLGGGTGTQTLYADSMTVQSQHEADINSQTDSIQASVLGASGSISKNYTYAVGGNAATGTVVTAQIAPNANLATKNITGKAINTTVKGSLTGEADNAYAGSGGLLDGAAAVSSTEVDNYTHFIIGDKAIIAVTGGSTGNPHLTNFDAINNITLNDRSHLDSGGAIAIAKAESLLKATLYADVTMGDNAAIDSVGPVNFGTRNTSCLNANAGSKTYGLSGAAQGSSNATVDVHDNVTIGAGASIRADGDISLMAGRDSSGVSNNLNSVAYTDLYNKTALPIETDPVADAVVKQDNTIMIKSGARIGSVANVNLTADKGITSASGQGIGKDLYRELLAEIGSAFSNLFGGGDVSLDIHGGSGTNTASSLAQVDGTVNAGIQHRQYLDVTVGATPDYSVNPAQDDEIVETVQIQVGSDSSNNPIYQTLTVRRTPGVTYSVGTEDLQSNLVTRINALQVLLGQYSGSSATQAALAAEIAFLKEKLAKMFPDGSEQSSVISQVTDVPVITVNNVLARSGNINIAADSLTGAGKLNALGDVAISIINRGQAYLRTNQLTIPEDSGGYVNFNGVSVSRDSDITHRNKSGSFTGVVTAAENSPAPEITVLNTYVPNTSDALAPDIEVSGDISNLRGTLTISSTSGSVNIESADPTQPLTAPSIAAGTINIQAGQDFVYNNADSWYNVGGDPRSIWGGIRDSSGNAVAGVNGSTTADTYENNYKDYAISASSTGTPSSSSASVASGRDGAGGAIAGNNIFISARYLNINGLIQSGVKDFELTIPDSAALTGEIQSYQADYNAKVTAGNPPTDPTYQLTHTSGNITAFYNAQTKEIELQPVRSQGGTIQLVGEILNTGGGAIKTMDGYSKITVTNNSGYNVVEQGLDTGGDGIAGRIIITDFAKEYTTTNSKGQTVTVPVTTTYTRTNGTVHVEETATVCNPDGTSTQHIVTANKDLGSSRGSSTDPTKVSYSPATGERFMWVTGSTIGTSDQWVSEHTTGGWFFNWSGSDAYSGTHTTISSGTQPIPSNGYETFTPSSEQRAEWGSQTNAYEYTGTYNSTGTKEWDVYKNWSSGFLGYYKHHERTHYRVTGGQIYNVNSVKGDYPIAIEFIGYDQGAVNITSNAGIVLDGAINNTGGSVTLSANQAITSTSGEAVINSPQIAMSAGTGIGNGCTGNTPVYFDLTNSSGVIKAISTSGDINLQSIQGIVNVDQIAAGNGGNVTLTADGSIVQAAAGDNAVITGHIINLTATAGAIGTDSQSLNVQIMPASSGDLNAGLSAAAAGDIHLRQPDKNFPLISITSTGGNVTIEAANGDLVNANPNENPDERNQAQILKLWENNQLLEGKGAETSAENTLTAYRNMMAQLYREYWLNARKLQVKQDSSSVKGIKYVVDAYDSNYLVPLSDAFATQLKALKGWNDEQLTAFRQQLTEDFGSGSYDPNYVYTIPTTGPNVIVQSDLTTGYSWSENQLQTGITARYFKQTSDTRTVIPDPNVTALNGNVTLKANKGSVGTDIAPVVISGDNLKDPTEEQRLALAAAEAVDIVEDNDATPSITVLQRRAINVDTAGVINIEARDHVYLGSQSDLRIQTAKAGESIRIKGQGSIYDVSIGGQGALQGGGAQGVILEAAQGSIGTASNPFTMKLASGTTLTARAGRNIYIEELSEDLSLASIYSPKAVYLTAAGSILDASGYASPVTIQAEGINLIADSGRIGSAASLLKVAAGADSDAGISASAAKGIYLESPSKVGNTSFAALNLIRIEAGDDVVVNTDGDIHVKTITAAGDISLIASGSIRNRLGNDAINLDSVNIALNAANGRIGDETARLTVHSTGKVNAAAKGDICLEARTGDLASDWMISHNGAIDLLAAAGGISVTDIQAPRLIFNLPASGGALSLDTIRNADSIWASADNVSFNNLIHTGSEPLQLLIGGGSKDLADSVAISATSAIGIVFDKLHADRAKVTATTDDLDLNNTVVGARAEIYNRYYGVLANNAYQGLEDFDAQLYPESTPFYLCLNKDRLILTNAYIVNYNPDFILNAPDIRNSFVRQAEMNLPLAAVLTASQPGSYVIYNPVDSGEGNDSEENETEADQEK
jgi:hypothetical protein